MKIVNKHETYASSDSVNSTRFETDAEGGLCGNNAGLNKGKNIWAKFLMSLGTKATDCFLVLSTSVVAKVFLGGCWLREDGMPLLAGRLVLLNTSELAWATRW